MAARDFYDVNADLLAFAPGVVLTRAIDDGLRAQYAANGFTPLTKAQVLAVTGTPPAYPKSLKRFADSNPTSFDDWSIEDGKQVK